MAYWFFYWTMRLLNAVYFRAVYRGLENLPKDGGFIIACNHISNLDPFIMGICQKRKFSFLAKDSLFKGFLMNWAFRAMGAFPVKRGTADLGALREAVRRLNQGCPLILFPEGTRGVTDREKKPQPGIGFISTKAQCPVIPAYIEGTEKALPNGAKWFRRHQVHVTFGKPLHLTGSKDYETISKTILDHIYQISPSS
ncbi:MAG: 1-acyl-sn-glycerol-3-phosphate acyltransferase [Candidatus Omnitrophica bacterium]|nr:1-acyl-sn-glycerol-3-phosphate acyltransferase [Candidatus Omnitrophota bacterium]